jgi:hypothetical protein
MEENALPLIADYSAEDLYEAALIIQTCLQNERLHHLSRKGA